MTTDEAHPSGRPALSDNEIIERFGGIRPMATKLGVAVTTVQGWKERGHIPPGRRQQIVAAAEEHGIDLGVDSAPSPPSETAPAAPATPAPLEAPQPSEPARESKTAPPAPPPRPEKTRPVAPEAVAAEEPTPAAQRPARQAPSARPRANVAWFALGLILVLALALLTRPYWEPAIHAGVGAGDPAMSGRASAELARIEATVAERDRDARSRSDAMAARIRALEAGGGEAGEAFAGQLADVEARMAEVSRSLAAISSSLSRLEDRLGALESTQQTVPEPVRREFGEIGARLDELQSGIAARDESFRAQDTVLTDGLAAIAATLSGFEARLSELETRPIQTGEKIAALALAIGQVEAALNSGRPYRSALDRLSALGQDDPLIRDSMAVAVLERWADRGIPDRLALHRRFVEIMPQIDRALASTGEEGWLDKVWNSVKGLITIRRIDGDGDLPPVSSAEIAMERGDLAAAAAAFEGAGSLGPEGDAWIDLLNGRIEAEREIESLYGLVIAPLAGTAGAGANTQ
jgi:uncharacterized protein YukE